MKLEYGFCFRPVQGRSDCSGRLHLWISYRGSTRVIPTTYDVRHDEWNPVEGRLRVSESPDHRRPMLSLYAESMEQDLLVMEHTIRELGTHSQGYSVATVVDAYRNNRHEE